MGLEVRDIVRALSTAPSQSSGSSKSVVRLNLLHFLEVSIHQDCPNCGHRLNIPEGDVRAIRGVSYTKKNVESEPEKQQTYIATRDGDLEL